MRHKRAILRCDGNLEQGFRVSLELSDRDAPVFSEASGSLPEAQALAQALTQWQQQYRSSLGVARITLDGISVQTGTLAQIVACRDSSRRLQGLMTQWLSSLPFQPIEQRLREVLSTDEFIEILLKSTDQRLHHIPWHLWDFIERYPNAELLISSPSERLTVRAAPHDRVRVLAILGDNQGIDTDADRQLLQKLSNAEVVFLVEPSRQEVYQQLWERPWDILFFAGHSHTEQQQGLLHLNPTETLTLEELRYGLRKAISRGLQLAIFNSCDGLGLAYDLEQLHIPQLIVMRQPVPDRVAQEFLKQLLQDFSSGEPLHASIRRAREYLQGLEGDFPCASWLPVMFQNSAVTQLTWQGLQNPQTFPTDSPQVPTSQTQPVILPGRGRRALAGAIATSIAVAGLVVGARYLGLMQAWELGSFDQLVRLRPAETPDSRLLIITVTEADIQAQTYAQEPRRGSLSDASLNKLMDKLVAYQPAAIGIDIYHDYPVGKAYPQLAQRMQQDDRFIAVCKVSDSDTKDPGVAPPPDVPTDRVSFSDVLPDSDQILRRQYLALTPPPSSPCQAPYSLAVQLTMRYLENRNIALEFPNPDTWKIGTLKFSPLAAQAGGYKKNSALGHQILLNYRAAPDPMGVAPQVTLSQFLAGQVKAEAVKDRIVLIGTTADSFHDSLLTPYRTAKGDIQAIPGVVLQAQMVSQLLSATLDGRSLIQVWPTWLEIIWIGGWAVVGGGLIGLLRRPLLIAGACVVAISILGGLCFGLLQSGHWVPLVPSAIALAGSAGLASIVRQRLNQLTLSTG
jgi:CHASE2 domain-containing sensor protein